jgi:putative flavoprotein involved in K+ transport
MRHIDAIIIGAGQAGLAMSHCLGQLGLDHIVIERGRLAERWRSERWDSLRLLTPNWMTRLPGWSYRGAEPDGFMTKQEFVTHLEHYASVAQVPLVTGATVRSRAIAVRGMRRVWCLPRGIVTNRWCPRWRNNFLRRPIS